MKKTTVLLMSGVIVLLSCTRHPSFKTSGEAIEACQKELHQMQDKKDASIKELTDLTNEWLELQDSTYSVFSKDSLMTLKNPGTLAYFVISDSVSNELTRLAMSKERSLEDVMSLKLNTSAERSKMQDSPTYKEAVSFYQKLDEVPTYPGLTETLTKYNNLLNRTRPFKKEKDLLGFLGEEDRCFHSLMEHLSAVSQANLTILTEKTTNLFGRLYSSVGNKSDDVNDRTMLYLTLRFNRRIIENAIACREDILNNRKLDSTQKANYRWMLIQPYMSLDSYSIAALTDDQREDLQEISKELPTLLNRLDGKSEKDNNSNHLTTVLANYFLKSYLSSTL